MNISIVIPVFNSSDFLARLLYSIFEKNIQSLCLQIIVVDDGSRIPVEHGLHDLKKIALIKNIELIFLYQDNSGPAAARNTGLKHIKGDYIWFCDADDCILDDFFNIILKNEPFEILEFGYYDEVSKKKFIPQYENSITTLEYLKITDGRFYLWNKIFHRSVLGNTTFDERLLTLEDYIFCLTIFSKGYYITPLNKVLYEYKFNKKSVTKKIDDFKRKQMSYNTLIVQERIIKLIKENRGKTFVFDRLLAISVAGYFFSLIKLKYSHEYFLEAFKFYLKNDIIYINPIYFFKFRKFKLFFFLCFIDFFLIFSFFKSKLIKV
ncbi:glycosyltransferase family 2 protein [Acinetobacter towneri]|uniref:glycosyltransferase family 2 protein n=1 Tax=Acinetobacter towneri TaxID=202956 RepID=UPI003A87F6B6